DSNRLHTLTSLVRTAIKKDESLKGHLILNEMERHTEPLWMNYRNFAITDDALIIYFDENTIAESLAGPPIVSLSIDTVNDYIASPFKREETVESAEIADKHLKEGPEEEKNVEQGDDESAEADGSDKEES